MYDKTKVKAFSSIRLKYLCDITTGNKDTKNATFNGIYPFYVRSPIIEKCDTYSFDGEGILVAGDGAGVGRIFHYANGKYAVHQRVYRLYNFKCEPRFLVYYLSSIFPKEMDKGSNQTTVPSMRLPMLSNFAVNIPSKKYQKNIVFFLDKKCAEIDILHTNIESQIKILEEYKKSIITEAVKKGLDSNVEMKDSGSVYWKYIPANWGLSDIKYLFEIVKRIAGKEGYDILSVTQKGLKIKDMSKNTGQIAESYANYQFVYPTDFVMNHMDLLTGWVDCSKYFGVTSPDYRVFRLKDNRNNLNYFKYVMQCCYMNKIFYSLGRGVSNLGRWRLQTESFNNFKIPVPPYEEQQKISKYLDEKLLEINNIMNQKKNQLETLNQYKKSLIYEYVTGKKEVE